MPTESPCSAAVAADSSDYFKVKEINALLLTKGVNPREKKARRCKQLALACTADEVQAFRAEMKRRYWPRCARRCRNATPGR